MKDLKLFRILVILRGFSPMFWDYLLTVLLNHYLLERSYCYVLGYGSFCESISSFTLPSIS